MSVSFFEQADGNNGLEKRGTSASRSDLPLDRSSLLSAISAFIGRPLFSTSQQGKSHALIHRQEKNFSIPDWAGKGQRDFILV
jgi:hypothetical protein